LKLARLAGWLAGFLLSFPVLAIRSQVLGAKSTMRGAIKSRFCSGLANLDIDSQELTSFKGHAGLPKIFSDIGQIFIRK
jgi:hypothetical protein